MSHLILIADDDPLVLKTVQQELEGKGYRVITANNGQGAIRLAQSQKPDLIVLDVAMPVTTGLKAYESLRTIPQTQKIPIIFLSGLPSSDVYPTVAQGVRVAHLKKPVDVEDLCSMIQQFLPDPQ